MTYQPIKDLFKIQYCDMCQCYMVICPKCGNNCCNSGVGIMDENGNALPWQEEGNNCDVCKLAYQYQELYWKMEEYCTYDKKCTCQYKQSENGHTLFPFEIIRDPNCPVHNNIINPNCPLHTGNK